MDEDYKTRFFLSNIKDNVELTEQYNKRKKVYEDSVYGRVTNPYTGKYRLTGKMNVIRRNAYKILLDNGNILLVGGLQRSTFEANKEIPTAEKAMEIYNPKTGKYSLINTSKVEININCELNAIRVIKLDDGRIFMVGVENSNDYASYTIYDPVKNNFTEPKSFFKGYFWTGLSKLMTVV